MVRQVNLYEAKTRLSQLVEDAAKGEDIVIAKNGKPLARLTRAPANGEKPKKRELGQWAKYLTPEQLADFGSKDWWRRWKEADAEIERDFEESINRPIDQPIEPWPAHAGEAPQEFKWADTSSTQTPSSGRRATRKRSAKKRAKPSKTRKTRSS